LSAEKSQRDAGATTCRQQFSLCKGKAGRALSRDVAPGSYRRSLKRCSALRRKESETPALQHVDNSFHFVRARQAVPFHAMLRPVPTGDPSNAAQLSAEKSQRDAGATTCRQQFSAPLSAEKMPRDAGAATRRQYAPGGCATAQRAGRGWKRNQGRKRRRSPRRG